MIRILLKVSANCSQTLLGILNLYSSKNAVMSHGMRNMQMRNFTGFEQKCWKINVAVCHNPIFTQSHCGLAKLDPKLHTISYLLHQNITLQSALAN